MTTDGDFSGTSAVRESLRFDVERLATWLREHVAEFRGPLTVERDRGECPLHFGIEHNARRQTIPSSNMAVSAYLF
jgi:hypothetical protein